MHPAAQKIVAAAQELGLSIEVVEFAQTTRTAPDAAQAIGCQVGQIVKSLLFLVAGQAVMALVAGNNRLDERKLAALRGVGRKQVRRADAQAARAATGFSIGGVPPFGHASPIPRYVDTDLLQFDVVWAAAGTPHAVFAIAPHELVRVCAATVADIKLDQ